MSARRQRQADAEQRRKELVEQLERDRDRVKKACDQVREFGEACKSLFPEEGLKDCGPLHPVGDELEKRHLGGYEVPEEFHQVLKDMSSSKIPVIRGTPIVVTQHCETLEECCKARGIELTGEASAEATEILNEAAEDEMVEKMVDEIVEVAAEADVEPFSFQSLPANEDAVIFDPKSRKLTEEEIKEVAGDVESLLVGELPEFSDTIIDMPVAGEPDVDKATPSGDGWE